MQAAIRKQAADATITRIEKNTEDDEVSYDVDAIKAGKKISFNVDNDGDVENEWAILQVRRTDILVETNL